METANQFFVREIQDMYNAEKQAVRALTEIEQQCQRTEIKRAAARHRRQTEGQIKRLDRVFRSVGSQPEERSCEGVSGLLQEKRTVEGEQLSPDLIDLNALMTALKFERYEVSAYETLIFMAQQMKNREAARLLKETLKEEQDTAKLMLEQIKKTKMDWESGAGERGETATARRAAPRRGAGPSTRRGAASTQRGAAAAQRGATSSTRRGAAAAQRGAASSARRGAASVAQRGAASSTRRGPGTAVAATRSGAGTRRRKAA